MAENLFCKDQKIPSLKFLRKYDQIRWKGKEERRKTKKNVKKDEKNDEWGLTNGN